MKTPTKPTSVQLPHHRKSSRSIFSSLTALAAGLALLGGQSIANAQTETFDSGAAIFNPGPDQWIQANVLATLGGSVNNSFPANGSGLAIRLQRGSADMSVIPFPQEYGTGRGWIYRTNDYTDFYVAMDLLDWNDATNQAMVLLARATGFNDAPFGPPGLGAVNGYVLNYDNRQDGQNPGDRNGGQFQINNISGEAPLTIAATEVTLTPGHSYRMVFKGVGSTLTGQVYDSEDLTKPIVTIVTDDTTWPSGKSGIVTFCRENETHPNSTDMTVDNYLAAVSDPNTDIAPAIRHPLAGTPQVVTRTPANRFKNFHPAASGISFTARTFTAGEINASATKLYLNGVDVSASLSPLPANGSTVSFTAAALAANTVYSARIELEDTTSTLKTTNTFWFDTFTDAHMASLKTVEAEDYNYSSGVYQLDPIAVSGRDPATTPVNGSGVGYFDLTGTQGIDYYKPGGQYRLVHAEYRTADRVQITQGSTFISTEDEAADILDAVTTVTDPYRIHDTQRSKYSVTNVLEYQVRLTSPGDWMNYTRSFAPTNYNVYLRCGSFGDTTVYLDQVTSDPTLAGQNTVRMGAFNVGNHIMRLNYKYEQLMAGSVPAVVGLSGLNTLRLTMGGTVSKDNRLIVMDYLVFVPTSDPRTGPTIFDDFNDANDSANPPWDRYDPIGGVAPPAGAVYTFPSGHYRIFTPAQTAIGCAAGPARAGSFLRNAVYNDFYASADLIDFDDTVRQAFGIAARINTPGLQTTGGYLFSWEPGSGSLPGVSNGDLDISRLVDEAPIGQIETASSGLHLTKGKSYRFVFMGSGTNFEGQVYELPDLTNPLIRLPANDPDNLYPSGRIGLISASQGSCDVPGDATWDNFLATTAEPRLSVSLSSGTATLSWPQIPFALQSTPSLSSPVWTTITSGITQVGNQQVYTVPATGTAFYRLIYP